MTLEEAVKEVDRFVGCNDGGCVFKRPAGMQTNGGHCRCFDQRGSRLQRALGALFRAAEEHVGAGSQSAGELEEELADAKAEIDQLESEIDDLKVDLDYANETIDGLRAEIEELEAK